jgi:hypothetical protein
MGHPGIVAWATESRSLTSFVMTGVRGVVDAALKRRSTPLAKSEERIAKSEKQRLNEAPEFRRTLGFLIATGRRHASPA